MDEALGFISSLTLGEIGPEKCFKKNYPPAWRKQWRNGNRRGCRFSKAGRTGWLREQRRGGSGSHFGARLADLAVLCMRVANTHPSPSPASAPQAAKSPGELAAPAPSASSRPPSLSHPAVSPPPPLLRKGSLEGHRGPPVASSS